MWLDRALATGAGTSGERATASFAAGQLELLHGEMSRAVELLEAAVLLAREAADLAVLAVSLGHCSWANYEHGERERCAVLLAECRELLPEVDDPALTSEVLTAVAVVTASLGDPVTADRLFREVLELERRLGDELGIADVLNNLGWTAWADGRTADARVYLEECLAIAERHGDDIRATLAVGNLGLVALAEERWEEAVELHLEELRSSNRRANRRGAAEALLGLATAYAELDDIRASAELYGAFLGLCNSTGTDPATHWLNTLAAPLLDRAWSALDPETIEELTARGRSLTPERVLERLESADGWAVKDSNLRPWD
jgi:tetratricopeptide (TPR) repeat protein